MATEGTSWDMAETVVWLPSLCGHDQRQYAFWDDAVTLNTSTPDVTVCFQKTVLLWVPCGWLWTAATLYSAFYLCKRPTRHGQCHFSWLNLIKMICSFLLSCITLLSAGLLLSASHPLPVDYMYEVVRFLTMVLSAVLARGEYVKGVHSGGVSCVYWLLQFTCDVIILRSWILRPKVGLVQTQFIAFTCYFSVMCVMFLLSWFSDRGALQPPKSNKKEKIPLLVNREDEDGQDLLEEDTIDIDNEKTLPERYAPFWMRVTFLWITGTILKCFKEPLSFSSLYYLKPSDRSCALVPRFYTTYNKCQSLKQLPLRDESGQKRRRASLCWALFRSGGIVITYGPTLYVIGQGLRAGQAMLLGLLIEEAQREDRHVWKGLLLGFALFIFGVLGTIFFNCSNYFSWLGAMRVRSITCALVYRKALMLSTAGHVQGNEGELMNLISVDAQKLEDACIWSVTLFEICADLIICTTLMWQVIGPSVLAGIILMCLIIPLNGMVPAPWIKKLQVKQMQYKDIRIKWMSHMLSGIKIIKLYAWEPAFLDRIVTTRTRELYYIKMANMVGAVTMAIWILIPYLMSLAIFASFVTLTTTGDLTPYMAFVTLSLLNVLSQSSSIIPIAVSTTAQAIVSIKRIARFLDTTEIETNAQDKQAGLSDAITIDNGSFGWGGEAPPILTSINLRVAKGQLVAVVGSVGSGKSSLLSAILGEMVTQEGSCKVHGTFAYVPQQAWIQNASLQDNVLFGKMSRPTRYNQTLEACSLLPDLDILRDGDQTEIGEKGTNLSGGQRQRVSLARAVYQDEDVYLLDDPLSAVDARVGRHIFERVISNEGLLKEKTRIFVTHHLSFLPDADVIVVINNGTISEMGTYNQLVEQGGDFAEFLETHYVDSSSSDGGSSDGRESPQSIGKAGKPRVPKPAEPGLTTDSTKKKSPAAPVKLIEEETPPAGDLGTAVMWRYAKAGGIEMIGLVMLLLLLYVITQTLTNFWLSDWAIIKVNPNNTIEVMDNEFHLAMYGVFGLLQTILIVGLFMANGFGCTAASYNLLSDMLHRVIKAPMAFFDCTPAGRILNRFSKDMDMIDSNILFYSARFLVRAGLAVSTLFVVTYTTPIFIIPCIPIVAFWAFVQLKRIDSVRRSPLYTHFDESLNGASSIRAYRRQDEFVNKCDRLIDESQRAFYLLLVAQRWLGVVMESLGSVVVLFAAVFATLNRDSLPAGMTGLSVSYALNITSILNFMVRMMTQLNVNMVSVERVNEYCEIDQEADWQIPDTETDEGWPTKGQISLDGYGTRYRPGLDLVLRHIQCDIAAGEKIGIVGRTGAGKSSLALALMRLIEAAKGSIVIDGVPIAGLGLHNLRSRITVIPQEPFIFSGSLKYNVDPLGQYSDAELWQALEQAHLKPFVLSLQEGLDHDCTDAGQSLSAGQRQLICLARAILRKSKVLILDEATAAVDLETDALIQTTIRDVFSDCTVLAIAHRLTTIMDYDRVMVIDEGRIAEFDSPGNLLLEPSSVFYSLARQSGIVNGSVMHQT